MMLKIWVTVSLNRVVIRYHKDNKVKNIELHDYNIPTESVFG